MNDEINKSLKQLHYFTIEKFFSVIIIFMIISLIIFNILRVYKNYATVNSSRDKFFYNIETILYKSGTIEVSIDENNEYPMLEIIINGEFINKFGKNKQLRIDVNDQDVVQINGSMYSDHILVNIKNISSNINNHLNNKEVVVKQNITTLAIIKM